MLPAPKIPQRSFADLEAADRLAEHPLCRLSAAIPWPAVEARLVQLYPSGRGRPSQPPLVLFRGLLLRRWFKLSDPALEAGLRDRLSWQYFCGLSLLDPIPLGFVWVYSCCWPPLSWWAWTIGKPVRRCRRSTNWISSKERRNDGAQGPDHPAASPPGGGSFPAPSLPRV
ncbi:MAG: transposase [Deltaproteobacteria bacterium]|nr:transposase [Deltaproteobacteria bacterium]